MKASPSSKQADFFADLWKDIRHAFVLIHDEGKSEADFCHWMVGVLRKQGAFTKETKASTPDALLGELEASSAAEMKKIIGALISIRGRMTEQVPRRKIETEKHLVRAIWTAARRKGMDEDQVAAAVEGLTNGETRSTKSLRRNEALTLIAGLGGTTVYTVVPNKSGSRVSGKKQQV